VRALNIKIHPDESVCIFDAVLYHQSVVNQRITTGFKRVGDNNNDDDDQNPNRANSVMACDQHLPLPKHSSQS
jgi:hypothetical protein